MIQSKELGIATATSKPTTASEDEKLLRAGKLGGAAEEEGAMDEIYLDGMYVQKSFPPNFRMLAAIIWNLLKMSLMGL